MVTRGVVSEIPEANRFRARYGIAKDVAEVHFHTLSKATGEGYVSALRVGLSYSALEALERVLKRGELPGTQDRHAVLRPQLALRLRDTRMRRLAFLLLSERTSQSRKLDERLEKFFSPDASIDVRPIGEKIRHLLFHGILTAHGAGITGGYQRQTLDELAEALLEVADLQFSEWVDRLDL